MEFDQKKLDLSRKLESAAKKHAEEIAKLKSDRDKRVEFLRQKIKANYLSSISTDS